MKNFKLDQNANVNMSSKKDDLIAIPKRLIELFGTPIEADGYKVSGEFIFTDDDNNVFTVYDWKSTNLYDDQLAPSPAQFWSSNTPQAFSIGGRTNASEFKTWIQKQLEEK